MIQPELISKYLRILETRIEDISMSITSGSASDMEQYRAMVGEIQGISFALDEIKTLLKRYIEDE